MVMNNRQYRHMKLVSKTKKNPGNQAFFALFRGYILTKFG